jgi:hypothetical protein
VALAYWDCIVSLVALVAAGAALAAQRALADRTTINTITIADYTIQVAGLPRSATVDQVGHLS